MFNPSANRQRPSTRRSASTEAQDGDHALRLDREPETPITQHGDDYVQDGLTNDHYAHITPGDLVRSDLQIAIDAPDSGGKNLDASGLKAGEDVHSLEQLGQKKKNEPLRGILKKARAFFPEEHNPIREGVAPNKNDPRLKDVPAGARWTKISRQKVNPEALEIGKERFEVRDNFVIVLRVLSVEEIQAYASATQILRARRREKDRHVPMPDIEIIADETRQIKDRGRRTTPFLPPRLEEDDVLLLRIKGVIHPTGFLPYSISDDILRVEDVQARVCQIVGLSSLLESSIRLIYKGVPLEDASAPVSRYGVKFKSELEVIFPGEQSEHDVETEPDLTEVPKLPDEQPQPPEGARGVEGLTDDDVTKHAEEVDAYDRTETSLPFTTFFGQRVGEPMFGNLNHDALDAQSIAPALVPPTTLPQDPDTDSSPDEEETIASEVDSILSFLDDASSVTSHGNASQGLLGLIDFLRTDASLELDIVCKVQPISEDALRRALRRFITVYGQDLQKEASNPLQVEVADFIRKSARHVAARIATTFTSRSLSLDQSQVNEDYLNKWIESQTNSGLQVDGAEHTPSEDREEGSDSGDSDLDDIPALTALSQAKDFLRDSQAHSRLRKALKRWAKSREAEVADVENKKDVLQNIEERCPTTCVSSRLATATLPMFISTLLDIWSIHFLPRVPKGAMRINWKCECGSQLWDDIINVHDDSLVDAKEHPSLGKSHGKVAPTLDSSTKKGNTRHSPPGALKALSETLGLLSQALKDLSPKNRANNSPSLPVHVQDTSDAAEKRQEDDGLHVLLCIDKGLSMTGLHQESLQNVDNDQRLFELLQEKYLQHRSSPSWLTFRGLKRVSLAKFNVDTNRYPDIVGHDQYCLPQAICTCIPPLSRVVDSKEYACAPAPEQPPRTLPALTPRRLTHYFLRPHACAEPQSSILNQLPKRSGDTLKALSAEFEDAWGLHFQEDWHWPSIIFVCAVFIIGSLIFGTVWAVSTGDIQSGFAISAVIMAIPPVPLALIVIQDSKHG